MKMLKWFLRSCVWSKMGMELYFQWTYKSSWLFCMLINIFNKDKTFILFLCERHITSVFLIKPVVVRLSLTSQLSNQLNYINNINSLPFLFLRKLDYVTFSCFLQVKSKLMMMTCFCGVADRQKAFGLISSRDHCQRSWPSWIFDMLQARFEPMQKGSDFVEWSCTVNSMKEKGFKWLYNFISPQLL